MRPRARIITPRGKPSIGDVMRDGTGRRFQILSVGLRYANVRPLFATEITECLVKFSELYPTVIEAEPVEIVDTFDGMRESMPLPGRGRR